LTLPSVNKQFEEYRGTDPILAQKSADEAVAQKAAVKIIKLNKYTKNCKKMLVMCCASSGPLPVYKQSALTVDYISAVETKKWIV